jgi:hypothetical protein
MYSKALWFSLGIAIGTLIGVMFMIYLNKKGKVE